MSDRDTIIQNELELITDFLNRQLDPVRAEAVRKRLEEDPDFLDLAAPLLFAWSVKPEWERPESAAEAEKHWDEFTKRADFAHHRKRRIRRNWWIVGIFVAAIGITGLLLRGEIQGAYRDWRDYAPWQADTGWTALRDHIQVRIEPGARLRTARAMRDVQRAKVDAGSVHFRVQLTDTTSITPSTIPLVILTRGGDVVSGYGDFTVTVTGDTTVVEEHQPQRQRYIGFMPFPSMTLVSTSDRAEPVRVQTSQRFRLVRGSPPERLP